MKLKEEKTAPFTSTGNYCGVQMKKYPLSMHKIQKRIDREGRLTDM
jgi:hypothetical protein